MEETCEACGAGAGEGPLTACSCGTPLHEDCARFSICPGCPAIPEEAQLPAVQEGVRARRTAAMLLDVGVLTVPSVMTLGVAFAAGLGPMSAMALAMGAAVGVDLVNVGLFLGEGGATLGKKLAGLEVTDAQGRHLGWRRAMKREFVYKVGSTLSMGLGFLGAMSRRGRTLHDALGDTQVRRALPPRLALEA